MEYQANQDGFHQYPGSSRGDDYYANRPLEERNRYQEGKDQRARDQARRRRAREDEDTAQRAARALRGAERSSGQRELGTVVEEPISGSDRSGAGFGILVFCVGIAVVIMALACGAGSGSHPAQQTAAHGASSK
jgi:hypothetical protein